ncbi:MAG: ParB N-terminal domain-containing protein [Flavobacteriales bacterium]
MANTPQDKQVSSIYKTLSYERYKFNSLQRVIKEWHVRDLMEKMKKFGFLPNKAISVNERNEIIDGHHRYLAAKNLGIPMLVQVCKGMSEESILESNQSQLDWDKHDFTGTFAKQGNQNYQAIIDFMKKYPKFKMTQTLILLKNEPNAHPKKKEFQEGKYTIGSFKKAEEFAVKIMEIADYFPKAYTGKFLSAIICCEVRSKDFVYSEFIDKLKKFPDKLTPSITTKSYLEKIEDLYNYHRNKKHHIKLSDLSADFEK